MPAQRIPPDVPNEKLILGKVSLPITVPIAAATNIDVIDEFRQFTAPCFLELDEYSKNYFTFTKVSIEEIDDTLVLSLYVSSLNVGSVSTNEIVIPYEYRDTYVTKTNNTVKIFHSMKDYSFRS